MRLSVEVFCIKSLHVTDFLVACVCVIKVNPLVTSQHCFEYIHDEITPSVGVWEGRTHSTHKNGPANQEFSQVNAIPFTKSSSLCVNLL